MIILKNKTIDIYRLIDDINEGEKMALFASQKDVFIEPLSEEVILGMDSIGAYEGYRIMSDFLDIKIGDKIIDQNNVSYIVKGAKAYENIIETHLEGILLASYSEDD